MSLLVLLVLLLALGLAVHMLTQVRLQTDREGGSMKKAASAAERVTLLDPGDTS
jgi:hypothetical protein